MGGKSEQPRLIETRREFPVESVPLEEISWDTAGARGRAAGSLDVLSQLETVLLYELPESRTEPALSGEGERVVRYVADDGNGRLEAMHELGYTRVQAHVQPPETTELERSLAVVG